MDGEGTAIPDGREKQNPSCKRTLTSTNPWVLIALVFCSHFLTCGVSYSIGVYYTVFLEVFGESYGVTSWIGSLNLGMLCATGPVASYMIDKLGIRHTFVIGGLAASGGILIGSFAPHLFVLFVSFGIITGFGYGLVFTGGVVVIGVSLTEYRSFAMGTSLAGIGLGNFTYPFIARYLMLTYGWRGVLMITSALTLHVCFFGMLMMGEGKYNETDSETRPLDQEECYETPAHSKLLSQVKSMDMKHSSCTTLGGSKTAISNRAGFTNSLQYLKPCKIRPYLTEKERAQSSELLFSTMGRVSSYHHVFRTDFASLHSLGHSRCTISAKSPVELRVDTDLQTTDSCTLASQLLEDGQCVDHTHATQHTRINKLFSFTLCNYWVLQCNVLFYCLSLSVVLTHLAAYSQYQGVPEFQGTVLISLYGAASVCGRIALGAFSQHRAVNVFWLYAACYCLAGCVVLVMTSWVTFPGLLVSVVIFGATSAAFGPVLSEVCLRIVGVEHFNYGYGYLMVSMAIGTTLGAPTAGWLYDVTDRYTSSFYFGGSCLLLSALLIIPLAISNSKSATPSTDTEM